MKFIYLYIALLSIASVYADITSSTGNVNFDVDSDNNYEMTLNSSGLGIGTSPSANLHVSGNFVLESGQLMLGTTSANSTLEISGSLGFSSQSFSSNGNVTGNASLVYADNSSANIELSLPFSGNASGRIYHIKALSSSYNLIITGGGLIDGLDNVEISPDGTSYPSGQFISDGRLWYIISTMGNAVTSYRYSDNLIGYYKLNETSGSTAANSGSSSATGSLQNVTFSSNSISGIVDKALSLSGGYADLGNSSDFDWGTGDFSITAWIKTTASLVNDDPNLYTIVCKGSGIGNNGWGFSLRGGAVYKGMVFRFSDGTGLIDTVPSSDIRSSINDGEWHFLAAVANRDGNASIYLDGNLVGSNDVSAKSATIDSSSFGMDIGIGNNGVSFPFQGKIDEVRLYNRELSSSDILTMYHSIVGY